MVAKVEQAFDLASRQRLRHVLVRLQQSQKIPFAAPDRHRIALYEIIGVLARDALLRQGQQYALRMDETAEPVEVFEHVLGIDQQLVDDAGEAREREIQRDRRVGADHPLDRGMGNVALVP